LNPKRPHDTTGPAETQGLAGGFLDGRQDLDAALAEAQSEDLARRLGVDLAAIKPCVALTPPQQEGNRSAYAFTLAVEFIRAGAVRDLVVAEVIGYAHRCDQPPRAKTRFSERDAVSAVNSAFQRAKGGGLRGFGCDRGPLRAYCPWGGGAEGKAACSYIHGRRRPPKRDRITTLAGAWSLARALPVPKSWQAQQTQRRRYIMLAVGALEALKGHAGTELITSLREFSFQSGINRRTLRRDLEALRQASWIEFAPGLSRRDQGERLARGCRIRRLLPPAERPVERVQAAFVGAREAL
jgi:hypothetical protein